MTTPTLPSASPFALSPIPSWQAQRLDHGRPAALYVAGSTAVRDFNTGLGVTAYKTGLSARRDVDDRVLDLRQIRYAAIVADERDRATALRVHPKGHEWFLIALPDPNADPVAAGLLAQLPEGRFEDGIVTFRMPPGVELARLEAGYDALLAPRDFNAMLASPDGRRRLAQAGLSPTTRLYTDYLRIGRPRRSLATELVCVRPKRECAVLLRAVVEALRREQERAGAADRGLNA